MSGSKSGLFKALRSCCLLEHASMWMLWFVTFTFTYLLGADFLGGHGSGGRTMVEGRMRTVYPCPGDGSGDFMPYDVDDDEPLQKNQFFAKNDAMEHNLSQNNGTSAPTSGASTASTASAVTASTAGTADTSTSFLDKKCDSCAGEESSVQEGADEDLPENTAKKVKEQGKSIEDLEKKTTTLENALQKQRNDQEATSMELKVLRAAVAARTTSLPGRAGQQPGAGTLSGGSSQQSQGPQTPPGVSASGGTPSGGSASGRSLTHFETLMTNSPPDPNTDAPRGDEAGRAQQQQLQANMLRQRAATPTAALPPVSASQEASIASTSETTAGAESGQSKSQVGSIASLRLLGVEPVPPLPPASATNADTES
ncbi:unnamed protein product [Amoebophrya sp. A25]|nr:unnamed protein product [Amoebophrya sp. A25]|eukprot:GSA25T00008640001.1